MTHKNAPPVTNIKRWGLTECADGGWILKTDHDAAIATLTARVAELEMALRWCAEHLYAGGKSFGDVEPVKSALADEDKP